MSVKPVKVNNETLNEYEVMYMVRQTIRVESTDIKTVEASVKGSLTKSYGKDGFILSKISKKEVTCL